MAHPHAHPHNPAELTLQEVVVPWLGSRIARVPVTVAGRLTSIGLGVIAMLHGTLTMVGGLNRWRSPAYSVLREAPGGVYISGLIALTCGIAILIGVGIPVWALRAWALAVLSCWAFVYGIGLLEAAAMIDTVSLTAGPFYIWFAYQCAVVISVDERAGKVVTQHAPRGQDATS